MASEIPVSDVEPETYLTPTEISFPLKAPSLVVVYKPLSKLNETKSAELDTFPNRVEIEIEAGYTFRNRSRILSDLGCSSGQVLSKTKSVTPHVFYISDITNSSSFNGRICRKKINFRKFSRERP